MRNYSFLILLIFFASSCASMFGESQQMITIETSNGEKAKAVVTTPDATYKKEIPTQLTINKGWGDVRIQVDGDFGEQTASARFNPAVEAQDPVEERVEVEDVVTTAGSAIKAINKLRENNFLVNEVLSVVDRQEGGYEALKEQNIKLKSLFSIKDFL